MLAGLPWERARAILDLHPREPLTANTRVAEDELRQELARTAARGYAIDNEERGHLVVVAPFRIFQIVEPGTLRLDRINQFDFRVSKIFRVATTRTNLNFDLYNVFNSTAVTQENLTYTPPFIPNSWRQPQYVVPSRFFKISAQFDF